MEKLKREIIVNDEFLQVERIEVPGGWLYVTTYQGLDGSVAVATVFIAN